MVDLKKLLAVSVVSLALSGCAAIKDLIPEHWDPNEAVAITDARYAAIHADCKSPDVAKDIETIQQRLDWLVLYTESRGSNDIHRMLGPAKETLDPLVERARKKDLKPLFCDLKMKIVREQLETISRAANARNML